MRPKAGDKFRTDSVGQNVSFVCLLYENWGVVEDKVSIMRLCIVVKRAVEQLVVRTTSGSQRRASTAASGLYVAFPLSRNHVRLSRRKKSIRRFERM